MLSMAGQVIAEDTAKAIEAAVHHEARLERDKARDGSRHPEAILNFFEVAPGQRVLDLFSDRKSVV